QSGSSWNSLRAARNQASRLASSQTPPMIASQAPTITPTKNVVMATAVESGTQLLGGMWISSCPWPPWPCWSWVLSAIVPYPLADRVQVDLGPHEGDAEHAEEDEEEHDAEPHVAPGQVLVH